MILSKSYDEIMEKIEVTDDMRTRILKNIQTADVPKNPKSVLLPSIRKHLSIAACFLILIAGALLLPKMLHIKTSQPDNELTNLSGDIITCLSASELSEQVGFLIKDIEQLPCKIKETTYLAYWGELAEITYKGDAQVITFRKSIEDEDNSGDYNIYDEVKKAVIGNITVILKGNNGSYNLAIWQKNDFSYSLSLQNGLSETDMLSLVQEIY